MSLRTRFAIVTAALVMVFTMSMSFGAYRIATDQLEKQVDTSLNQRASRIIASDVNPRRLALARTMGAHEAVQPGEVEAAVRTATDGLGVDIVLEMSGIPAAIHQGFKVVRAGGRVQHKAPVGLHRPAVMHGNFAAGFVTWRDFNLLQQRVQREICQVEWPVDHHTQRALFVMLADKGQRFGEMRISHGGHGDQKMPGQVDGLHCGILLPPPERRGKNN